MTPTNQRTNEPAHPLILAHRGARKYAPENTISAFKKAIELEVDGVEFDLLSTLDGLPVVVHDNDLLKLTGRHLHVSKTGYNELLSLDFGYHFNPYYSGEKIPTFKKVLELFSGTKMALNIELKTQPSQNKNFIKHMAETIKSVINPRRFIISSFSPLLLHRSKKLLPGIPHYLLMRPRAFYFLRSRFFVNMLSLDGICPHISILSKRLVGYAHSHNLGILTWTANTPEQINKACELGVDGLITDEPVLAKEVILCKMKQNL